MRLLAVLRSMDDAQVMLQVLKGSFGANKTYWVNRPSRKGIILFFPGDQLEHALAPPEIRRLQDPKVQAQLMASKFAACSSVVVMPSRLEGSFACFDHFLNRVTRSGEPLGYQGASLKASSQIASLLQAGCPTGDNKEMVYHLVGFSKGGVVLNQVLSEVAACWEQSRNHADSGSIPPQVTNFIRQLGELHFLDAGLNCRGAHLTDPQVLQSLSKAMQDAAPGLRIHLHGTPRQWDNEKRPWVRQEKMQFQALLEQNDVVVVEHKYFAEGEPTLLMHFEAIEAMQRGA